MSLTELTMLKYFIEFALFRNIVFFKCALAIIVGCRSGSIIKNEHLCFNNGYDYINLCKKKYTAELFSPYSGEAITHYGRYIIIGDTIILNSKIVHSNKGLKVYESYDKNMPNDSITFYVAHSDPSLIYSMIEFGRKHFYIGPQGKMLYKNDNAFVLHGWGGDFAPFRLQNDSTNVVMVTYSYIDGVPLMPHNSYFFNEKFILKNDSLINIKYNYTLKKQKCI